MKAPQTDCEIISSSFENVFHGVGECFDTAADKSKTKSNVIGSIFKLGTQVTKLTWNLGKCTVKHAPKAIATVAAVKREVVSVIEEEVYSYQQQAKESALDQKIEALKIKSRTK